MLTLGLKLEAEAAGRRRVRAAADESALRAAEAAADDPALNAAAGAIALNASVISKAMPRKVRFAAVVERCEQDARYVLLECEEDDDEEGADRRDFATTPAAAGVMQARGWSAVLVERLCFRMQCYKRGVNHRPVTGYLQSSNCSKFVVGAGPVDVTRHQESTP